MNWARLPTHIRLKPWAQCAQTATQLKNIIIKQSNTLASSEQFYG